VRRSNRLWALGFSVFCLGLIELIGAAALLHPRPSLTLEQCSMISQEVNKSVPVTLDRGFVVQTTQCEVVGGSPTLVYKVKSPVALLDLKALRQHSVNHWCDDPKQKQTLRVAGVSYLYLHTSTGKPIGRNDITFDDCPRPYRR
jgi:hypothetical protein